MEQHCIPYSFCQFFYMSPFARWSLAVSPHLFQHTMFLVSEWDNELDYHADLTT